MALGVRRRVDDDVGCCDGDGVAEKESCTVVLACRVLVGVGGGVIVTVCEVVLLTL